MQIFFIVKAFNYQVFIVNLSQNLIIANIRSNLCVVRNGRFTVNLKSSILGSLKARKMNSPEPSPLPYYP